MKKYVIRRTVVGLIIIVPAVLLLIQSNKHSNTQMRETVANQAAEWYPHGILTLTFGFFGFGLLLLGLWLIYTAVDLHLGLRRAMRRHPAFASQYEARPIPDITPNYVAVLDSLGS